MQRFFVRRLWIFSILALSMTGCSSNKLLLHERERDRTGYYPLAIVLTAQPPSTEFEAHKTSGGGSATLACMVSLGPLCGIIIGPLIGIDVAANTALAVHRQAVQQEFEKKIQSLKQSVKKAANPARVGQAAMEYLQKQNANAKEFSNKSLPDDADKLDKFLSEHGYPMMIQLSLLSLDFLEVENNSSKQKFKYCLVSTMQAKLVRTDTNKEVLAVKKRGGKCQTLDKWFVNGSVKKESNRLYAAMATRTLNELLFTYNVAPPKPVIKKNDDYTTSQRDIGETNDNYFVFRIIGLNPIYPKVVIKNSSISTSEHKALKRKDLMSSSKQPIFEADTKQRFEWSAFSGPGISNVRYDFGLFKGAVHTWATTDKKNIFDFSGNRYPLGKHIIAKELVYSRRNIPETYLEMDAQLESCSWYFWSVRAVFDLNGYPRVTDWSGIGMNNYEELPRYYSYFPFRTPASKENPSCWDTPVDWGPLPKKSRQVRRQPGAITDK